MFAPADGRFRRMCQAFAGLAGRSHTDRVAILIDGDNTPPRAGDALFSYARTLGRVATAELFANFAGGGTAGWAAQIRHHGIVAQQQFNTSSGKNGADIALAIAALDLAHEHRIDTYVISTSDADLAPVAHRLRKSGAKVHGLGSASAASAFKQACDTFIALDDLDNVVRARTGVLVSPSNLWRHEPHEAEDHILGALIRLGGARNWVEVPRLGEELSKSCGRFDPRAFGRRNLTSLLDALDSVLVDQTSDPRRARIALDLRNGSTPSARNGCVPDEKS